MGATKHCCYGNCRSDSRYSHRDEMKDVFFIRFPKAHRNLEKCQRWIYACGRKGFCIESIKKDTYICSLHFVGKNGPTDKYPDPIPATYTGEQVQRFSRKRKAPTQRDVPVLVKQQKRQSVDDICVPVDKDPVKEPVSQQSPEKSAPSVYPVLSFILIKQTKERGTQTDFKSQEIDQLVRLKSENTILKNEVALLKNTVNNENSQCMSKEVHFSFEDVEKDEKKCTFYTGLTCFSSFVYGIS
ncbi:uncharacterized protein [Ptychodera flava]|uniref:uncharacterized protein n=1 Tax=Ptychodera flava TaxID=63121 RepID=UPI00396AAE08